MTRGQNDSSVANLLARPADQRLREYKYRFGQSIVFGLPVIALQIYGRALGPADSERWVSLLQALLAGWIMYVNLGMLFEGVVSLPVRRRISGELVISAIAVALYLYSLVSASYGIVTRRLLFRPLLFHVAVIVLALWSGWRWWRMSRAAAAAVATS